MRNRSLLDKKMLAIDDLEGMVLPDNLPLVIDAHVHLFPDSIFYAVRRWFNKFGWPIRYKLKSEEIIEFLLSKGVAHVVGLQYAHKAGIAERLNDYMLGLCQKYPNALTGLATIFPGEPGAGEILEKAFQMGLSGVKLHAHVQCFDMTDPVMHEIYETCAKDNKPIVMHVSREPKSTAYKCDPYEICSADKLETVIRSFPNLKVCVPHMGIDEYDEYALLIEKYDNLWLDTTMVYGEYFKGNVPDLTRMRADRIMYGTDFPNIPYAWDREIKLLAQKGYPKDFQERLFYKNAVEFFGIKSV